MLAIVASNVVPSTVAIQVGLAGGFACGLGWLALTQVGYKAGLYSGVPRFRLIQLICTGMGLRSEEHTSELQSLMRISYAVFCLTKKKQRKRTTHKIRPSRIQPLADRNTNNQ